MGDAIRQIAVICEKQEALGFLVQATHGKDSLLDADQQIDGTLAAVLVALAADVAPGFVQEIVDLPPGLDADPIAANVIFLRVHQHAHFRHNVPVNGDPAFSNDLLARAA